MAPRVPLIRPTMGAAEAAAARRVVLSGRLSAGPEVEAFEREMEQTLGIGHAVAVANGSIALELSLRGLGIGPGDEVVTTAFSFFATAASILRCGALPVLADIDPTTWTLEPGAAAAAITPRTAALMPVHLYGRPCDMEGLTDVARRHGIMIVEDACQAIGARYRGQHVGSFGVGCFSFYGSKNVSAGEGGAVTTRDAALAARLRALRNHGSRRVYRHDVLSSNHRLTDLQAAILRVQLGRLEWITGRRRAIARRYGQLINSPRVTLPPPDDGDYRSSHHLYTLAVAAGRTKLREHLEHLGIESRIHYPRAIHRQPAWSGRTGPVVNAERAVRRVLSIPIHPGLSRDEVRRVADAVNHFDR